MRRFNWPLWTGFLLAIAAFISYFAFFARFPVTRDVPWVNLILFAAALVLLFTGVRRALHTGAFRTVVAVLLGILGTGIAAAFIFFTFYFSRQLPASLGAPAVGTVAPAFTLPDLAGKPTSLAQLLSEPVGGRTPKGVLLVFYRGYW
ncbi:MAG TPA: hypothetical protein VFN10_11530 [Thermoanaerobaculia bacterium]|nr:hypothetical protein [Thermoanaerobaculia bacterium]